MGGSINTRIAPAYIAQTRRVKRNRRIHEVKPIGRDRNETFLPLQLRAKLLRIAVQNEKALAKEQKEEKKMLKRKKKKKQRKKKAKTTEVKEEEEEEEEEMKEKKIETAA